ncbi:MAG: hypothetical protein HY325_06425 [Chloroflexi bacterium]|nr:hypothetical protein [Chloroflexota bacterium]
MRKQTFSTAVVGWILSLLTESKRQDMIPAKYPLQKIKPFAYLVFITGAVITKLEPQRLQSVNEEMTQLRNYDMSISEDWVEQVEEIRKGLGEKTSDPYFIWVDGETADAVKSKKRGLNLEHIEKIGMLSFHYGCIFGARYPERVESMFQADRQRGMKAGAGLSWKDLVEDAKDILKEHSL